MANAARCTQFTQISGWVFVFIGLIGFFLTDLFGLIRFDAGHNALHIALGSLSLWLCYKGTAGMQVNWTKWAGVSYLLFGAVGFFIPQLGSIGLEPLENLLHLILGGWGIWAGFFSK